MIKYQLLITRIYCLLYRTEKAHFRIAIFEDKLAENFKFQDCFIHKINSLKNYTKTIINGLKYNDVSIPRMITIWFEILKTNETAQKSLANKIVKNCVILSDIEKFFHHSSQIFSRIGNSDNNAFKIISYILYTLIVKYPHQTLWKSQQYLNSHEETVKKRVKLIIEKYSNVNETCFALKEVCRIVILGIF